MVMQILSLSRSGLTDFVIQRVSAVILGAYSLCLLGFFLGDVSHQSLTAFFWSAPMQAFSTLALLSMLAHAWIGMWTIGTDYIRPVQFGRLATTIRFSYQIICLLVLFIYFIWALRLVWQF